MQRARVKTTYSTQVTASYVTTSPDKARDLTFGRSKCELIKNAFVKTMVAYPYFSNKMHPSTE